MSLNQHIDNINPKVQRLLSDASTLEEDVAKLKTTSDEMLQGMHETQILSTNSAEQIERMGQHLARLQDDLQLFQEDKVRPSLLETVQATSLLICSPQKQRGCGHL